MQKHIIILIIFKMADDEKVIKGAPVNFEGDSNIPTNTLEQNTNNQNGFERLQLIEDKLSPNKVYAKAVTNFNTIQLETKITIDFTKINYLIPYVIKVKKFTNAIMQYHVEINNEILIKLFELKYGESFKKTGIIEATKLNESTPANINDLQKYISEFKEIAKLMNRYSYITDNPYLTILGLPIEARPLFTEIMKNEKIAELFHSKTVSQNFAKPITFDQIIKYAEKRNELDKVTEYVKAYNDI